MSGRPVPRIGGTVTAAIVVPLLLALHGTALALQWTDDFRPNIAAMIAESLVYCAAALVLGYGRAAVPLWLVLSVAALLRLSILPFETYHSTDIFRYIWDGRVQAAGINPYLYVPNDPVLAPLRDEAIWPHINRGDYAKTIYPPVTEMIFFLATQVGQSVLWMKTVLLAIEAAGIWAVLRLLDLEGLPRRRVLLYAWCPLPVWEIAGSGHVDAATMSFVMLAILAVRRGRDLAGGAALGLAVLVKFFPLMLVPALWRRWDRRLPLALGITIIVGYGVYLSAGSAVLGFVSFYAGEQGMTDGSGLWLLVLARAVSGIPLPSLAYMAAVAILLAALALIVTRRPPGRERLYAGSLVLGLTGMVALSPEYPWYFVWLVPFLCFVRSLPLLWILGTAYLLYWDAALYVPWIEQTVYGGAILIGIAGFIWRSMARSRSAKHFTRPLKTAEPKRARIGVMSYSLVLVPFAEFNNIRAGQLTGAGLVVDSDFVRFLRLADDAAAACGITMLINQAFHKEGTPITGAVVPSVTNGQHVVGRALDANLLENGKIWGSGNNNPATAISPTASAAVGRFLGLMSKAGFRWGGVWVPADRIHWDAWIDPNGAEYQAKYRLFQSQAVPVFPSSGVPSSGVPPSETPPSSTGGTTMPAAPGAVPDWFARDVAKKSAWLPAAIKSLGVDGAYQQRWNSLPADIQATLTQMAIPAWMIALIPTAPATQEEILKQFRFMPTLAGPPPADPVAARAEQLLMFGGCAQLPTPGDSTTGASLGAEGCTAAMAKYILAQLKREFPQKLAWMSDALATSQYSPQMLQLFQQAAARGFMTLVTRPFAALQPADIHPGSLMIAQKPGGTHVFGWTRVAAGWNWQPGDKMAIGNTGLPQFGDRMILAQEYVTDHPEMPGELTHNQHGPINSTNVIYVGGKPDLTDPRTNVYAVQASSFVLINFPG